MKEKKQTEKQATEEVQQLQAKNRGRNNQNVTRHSKTIDNILVPFHFKWVAQS
ncbi:MAG: hypothetical protein HQL05_14665 [Nitrospirae bacterium]|nr:hypothetical protein [Nitrospirota bacterium]